LSAVIQRPNVTRRFFPLWLVPVQAVSVLTVSAAAFGGQVLRGWLLAGVTWLLALPLLVSLEAGLIAMMLFEPFRGLLRRAQYLFIEYSSNDPIHVLTPVVTIMAVIALLRSHGLGVVRATPMAGWVSALAAIYFVEIFNPLQGGLLVGFSGAMFWLAPLVWFYFGQFVTSDFITKVLKLMVALGLVTSLYGVYQLVIGYPEFELYWIRNTEFYTSIALGHVERALATFSSAEEWGRYCEFAAIAAFGMAIGQKRLRARLGWLIAGIGLVGGVALTGQRAAAFGMGFGLIVLFVFTATNIRRGILRVMLLLLPFVIVAMLVKPPQAEEVWSNDETQTVTTVLSHTQRGMLKPAEEASFQERMTNWAFLLTEVIPFRPLGAGIGAGSLSEWRFNQGADELPPVDSSILMVGITCGIPGILLFVWILCRSALLSLRLARRSERERSDWITRQIVVALMVATIVNSVFGLTFTLYSIAPLVWLFMGWISAETMRAHESTERETIVI
jgi:O-antigen ligase/polysaccharide polymerase Wzy-like membrane protein